ncbi:MAG: hypothetical protein KGN16_02935 [Burkholderiales bacterium]|nr:hypothetical protein [Burkholderiales bacterium]
MLHSGWTATMALAWGLSAGAAHAGYVFQDVVDPVNPAFTQVLGINKAGTQVVGISGAGESVGF